MSALAPSRLMLSVFGRERVPQLEPPEDWKWVKAWAARWWLVECHDGTLEDARRVVASVESGSTDPLIQQMVGRVVDCGRNGRGGPERSLAPGRARTAPAKRRRAATAAIEAQAAAEGFGEVPGA